MYVYFSLFQTCDNRFSISDTFFLYWSGSCSHKSRFSFVVLSTRVNNDEYVQMFMKASLNPSRNHLSSNVLLLRTVFTGDQQSTAHVLSSESPLHLLLILLLSWLFSLYHRCDLWSSRSLPFSSKVSSDLVYAHVMQRSDASNSLGLLLLYAAVLPTCRSTIPTHTILAGRAIVRRLGAPKRRDAGPTKYKSETIDKHRAS